MPYTIVDPIPLEPNQVHMVYMSPIRTMLHTFRLHKHCTSIAIRHCDTIRQHTVHMPMLVTNDWMQTRVHMVNIRFDLEPL